MRQSNQSGRTQQRFEQHFDIWITVIKPTASNLPAAAAQQCWERYGRYTTDVSSHQGLTKGLSFAENTVVASMHGFPLCDYNWYCSYLRGALSSMYKVLSSL